jgi:hypothetical protein
LTETDPISVRTTPSGALNAAHVDIYVFLCLRSVCEI